MKVMNLEFLILSIWIDSPMLSWIFYYIVWNLNSKIPSRFDYKQDINLFEVRFVGVDLKCNTFDVVIFLKEFVV
jgi:hypothetical protein